MQSKSSYYRTHEASPLFPFKNAQMLTGTYWLIDIAEDNIKTQKHLPFDNVQIINNSTMDIYIYPNQGSEAKVIPAGTILTFSRPTIPALRSLRVFNAGAGTINANELELTFWREGVVIDETFRNLHKLFYKLFRPNW